MSRLRLKCGGKTRRKALLGADGAVTAAAIMASSIMNVGATIKAANTQAKAVKENANLQKTAIETQTTNNETLEKERINFTRQQNQENLQQQRDTQLTLQQLAGQANVNDRMESTKMQVKMGGRPKKPNIKSVPFYGGANLPFRVTDGGGVIPIQTDSNGYGLYELYGNDHEHSHIVPGGKRKTGVGIKFSDGSVVEGEGNQNTNQGELMYVTPNDAVFISKHSIAGFNPTEAVKSGVHPVDAFNAQETLKTKKGLKDDGSKAKCGTRRSLKRTLGGFNVLDNTFNITQLPSNGTVGIAGGAAYTINNIDKNTSPVAKCGKRINIKRCGGRNKAALGAWLSNIKKNWGDYAGATYSSAGNLLGAGINVFGNMYAGRKLSQAYAQAGDILSGAYSQMKGIDMSELKREDYDAPHSIAVIRDANTNINPQLERIRRNSVAERREINRGTMSSAARQQRLAGINDRMMQKMSEQYAYKTNADEQIRQANAERITNVSAANADRDAQARRDYTNQKLSLLQYNNSVENARIAGMAQAKADALTQSATTKATTLQSSMNAVGSALQASGQEFGNVIENKLNRENTNKILFAGADTSSAVRMIIATNDADSALTYYNNLISKGDADSIKLANNLAEKFGFNKITVPSNTTSVNNSSNSPWQTFGERTNNYIDVLNHYRNRTSLKNILDN